MLSKKVLRATSAAIIFAASSLFLTDCTSMISEEQLAMLQDLRRQEAQLTEEIQTAKADLNKLKSELKSREVELNDCNDKTQFVKDKLSKWPNVWPDNN
jgi:predicted nuclease with TOPRIM domain